MTTTAPGRDDLRAQARQLITEGLSNREIGRRLGVGKDTVRRWRATAPPAEPDAPPTAPHGAPPAPQCATTPTPGADGAPHPLTISLDLDADDLGHDLDVLAAAGLTPQAAAARAVHLLAHATELAWDLGDAPRGSLPRIVAHAAGATTLHCTPRVRRPAGGAA